MANEDERRLNALRKRATRITPIAAAKAAFLLLLLAYLLWGLRALVRKQALDAREQVVCRSHLIDLWRGMQMYAMDWGDRLPPAHRWCDALTPPIYPPKSETFRCPAVTRDTPSDYAMNTDFSATSIERVPRPHESILLYDSAAARWNASDALTSLPRPPRHPSGNNCAMADGAIKWVTEVRDISATNRQYD
ncbi:MAG: hypothetical protein ACE5O2_03830 [Armatimonadota bacterium]